MKPLIPLLLVVVSVGQTRTVSVIAHRGEHLSHPENTLAAYTAAMEAGADFFEVDVRTTADGKLVLMHDATVDRTTNGHGRVSALTLVQIRSLSVRGEPVPGFEEALALARGRAGVYVDSKRVSPADLVAALRRQRMSDHVVVYGGFDFLKEVRALDPSLRVMPEAVSVPVMQRVVSELKAPVIAFSAADWLEPIIVIARKSGADVYVDRLGADDNPDAWEDAVKRGATGIQTDHPAELVRYLRSRQLHR